MFDWKQFIQFAEELYKNSNFNNTEALYRTIISRAYYGIFKQVEDCLSKLKQMGVLSLPVKDVDNNNRLGSHEKFIYFFKYHENDGFKQFGELLELLKGIRTEADYGLENTIDKTTSEAALDIALMLNDDWNNTVKPTLISSLNIQKHSPPPC